MLTHDGFEIPGTHELTLGPWDYQRQPNGLFGVAGQTVLVGERTTREITAESWLYNSYSTPDDLQSFLDDLADQAGEIGTLVEATTALDRTFDNVEFQRYEYLQGPIPPSGTTNSWLAICRLHFLQVQP